MCNTSQSQEKKHWEDSQEDLRAIIELRQLTGMPVYPRFGTFSVKVWAWFACGNPEMINNWIKKWKIPCRQPGAERMLDAEDFHNHIPYEEIE